MATAAEDDKAKPRTGDGAGPAGSADIENPASVASLARRWRGEGFPEKAALPLRAMGWLFSALAFLVMACNKHGDWRDFGNYQEYRYLVAASVLAFLYTTVQVVRQVHLLAGQKDALPARTASTVDFAGDQVAAYLLISAVSAAVPITNRMREGNHGAFTDSSAAAISMAFFAFVALASSALASGLRMTK